MIACFGICSWSTLKINLYSAAFFQIIISSLLHSRFDIGLSSFPKAVGLILTFRYSTIRLVLFASRKRVAYILYKCFRQFLHGPAHAAHKAGRCFVRNWFLERISVLKEDAAINRSECLIHKEHADGEYRQPLVIFNTLIKLFNGTGKQMCVCRNRFRGDDGT